MIGPMAGAALLAAVIIGAVPTAAAFPCGSPLADNGVTIRADAVVPEGWRFYAKAGTTIVASVQTNPVSSIHVYVAKGTSTNCGSYYVAWPKFDNYNGEDLDGGGISTVGYIVQAGGDGHYAIVVNADTPTPLMNYALEVSITPVSLPCAFIAPWC